MSRHVKGHRIFLPVLLQKSCEGFSSVHLLSSLHERAQKSEHAVEQYSDKARSRIFQMYLPGYVKCIQAVLFQTGQSAAKGSRRRNFMENIGIALEIMAKGMGGIFAAIVVILITVMILGKICAR